MTAPRRNLLRPAYHTASEDAQQARRRQKIQTSLERSTLALTRWQSRLRRAFNAVEKHQRQIARLNQQLKKLDS